MTIKFKFHLNSQKIEEDRKQRENHFFSKDRETEKKSLWLKHIHAQLNIMEYHSLLIFQYFRAGKKLEWR